MVLELLRQVLREPSLPESEWEVQKREALGNLEEQLADPQSLAIVRLGERSIRIPKEDVRHTFPRRRKKSNGLRP